VPDNARIPDEFNPKNLNSNEKQLPAILAEMGFFDYAYDEAMREAGGLRSPAYYWAATNFTEVLRYGISALKHNPSWDMAAKFFCYAYPLAYGPQVIANAHSQQINPHLVWSVMRQESTFKATAVSPALAIGLMQVIPSTGHEIAEGLGLKNFHHEELKNPALSIRFGSWYLKHISDIFGGALIPTLAAYNAGPEAVTRWLKWGAPLQDDEFIELIPYEETNTYVKKVLSNYWIYNRLYGAL
jgi:soluble lytic murein transglycosylase-like protein